MRGSGRYLISSWQRTRRRIKERLVLALAAPESIGRAGRQAFQLSKLTGSQPPTNPALASHHDHGFCRSF